MRKPLSHYRMIYFDASDTLLTIPAARLILQQYMAARSLHREEEHIGELFTEAFRLFYYGKQSDLFEACTPESDRAFWVDLYKYVLGRLGAGEAWTEDEIHQRSHELYDIYTAPEHYELFSDVKETLSRLRQMGLRLGIVSNFAPTLKAILESKGILHHFDPVLVSTEVGLEKPDPAIFQLALDKAGLAAEHILYVGDHERNDIWSPKQVGIDAVQIVRYDNLPGQGIDAIYSLRELVD